MEQFSEKMELFSGEQKEFPADEIEQAAFAEVKKRVRARFAGEPYHHAGHSFESVLPGAENILDKAEDAGMEGVNEEIRLAVRFAAAAHDMVIRRGLNPSNGQWLRYRGFAGEVYDEKTGKTEIKDEMPKAVRDALARDRWQKGNEEASWLEVEHIMDETDPDGKVFTKRVREIVRAAIGATYPDVRYPEPYPLAEDTLISDRDPVTGEIREIVDMAPFLPKDREGRPAGLKFFQPFLTAKSPLAVVAIAMGDLMEGGRVDAREFQQKGNAEFWETRKATRERVANDFAEIQDPVLRGREMALAAGDMLGWAQSQGGFLLWQKVRYREILSGNDAINADPQAAENFKKKMDETYRHFDENILASVRRANELAERYKILQNADEFAKNPEAVHQLRELANAMDYEEFLPQQSGAAHGVARE